MLTRVIEWSLANRFFVVLGTVAVVGAGTWAMVTTPVDAIPDLSDVQVIVETEWAGQAPQVIEDQVTYPLSTIARAMCGRPTAASPAIASTRSHATGTPSCSRFRIIWRPRSCRPSRYRSSCDCNAAFSVDAK